ncbi:unnamed protein product [Cyprideis torosa]|uniref:Teneurin-1-4-like galactose-binding domain-containing protein n=1 Tax=Cyprideis torosa TaxID=163714 RepID=A0A7R8ZPC4_9CRUS|nr:unnamed protein product [Cyprideis torosa]CAG0898501.1 unnamed protein product [Cyprideis torosa]
MTDSRRTVPPDSSSFEHMNMTRHLTTTLPPHGYLNLQFLLLKSHPIRFNVTIPRGADVAVYGRRNALPSLTRHDFFHVIQGYTPREQRARRSLRSLPPERPFGFQRSLDLFPLQDPLASISRGAFDLFPLKDPLASRGAFDLFPLKDPLASRGAFDLFPLKDPLASRGAFDWRTLVGEHWCVEMSGVQQPQEVAGYFPEESQTFSAKELSMHGLDSKFLDLKTPPNLRSSTSFPRNVFPS